jgi:hypothetical protein
MTKRIRSKLLTLWVTPEEYAGLMARAQEAGLSLSRFVRRALGLADVP